MMYFKTTMWMGFGGIFLGLYAWMCSHGLVKDPAYEYLFWKIPMALFGITGYILIGLSSFFILKEIGPTKILIVANHALVGFAALFTIYLIFKAIRVELLCPGCILCWCLNVSFGYRLVNYLLR